MQSVQELEAKIKEIIKYKEQTQNLGSYDREKILESYKDLIGEFNYGRNYKSTYKEIVDNLTKIVSIEDGKIVVSGDIKVFDGTSLSREGNEYGNNYTSRVIPEEDRILVHCTNYFPNDGVIKTLYDGKKEFTHPIKVNGEEKEVDYRHHRHTAHFVSNGVVGNTGDGNIWENMKYIVFEPASFHKDQIVNDSFSDMFTNGSVKLSDKAILMVEKDAYDKLTEEQKENYNIVLYTGNFRQAVQNLLVLGNQKLSLTDAQDVNHARSINLQMEVNLNYRDMCLNYVNKYVFDGASRMNLTLEQLVEVINLFKENYTGYLQKCFTYNDKIVEDPLLTFIYGSGIVANGDGTFSVLSEEEVKKRYIHDNSPVSTMEVNDVDFQEAIGIKDTYEKTLMQNEIKQNEYNQMMEELDEAYELNDLLSTNVGEISLISQPLSEYLNYISEQLNKKMPLGLIARCSLRQMNIFYTNEEYEHVIEKNELYDEIIDGITIKFDNNKSLLENINNGTKKMYEIVSDLEKMKDAPTL